MCEITQHSIKSDCVCAKNKQFSFSPRSSFRPEVQVRTKVREFYIHTVLGGV